MNPESREVSCGIKGAEARRRLARNKDVCPKCGQAISVVSMGRHQDACKPKPTPAPKRPAGPWVCQAPECKRTVRAGETHCIKHSGGSAELDRIVGEPRAKMWGMR